MSAAGIPILKLNTGNPATFGFKMPDSVRNALVENADKAVAYCDLKGMPAAREAIWAYEQSKGITSFTPDDIYIGNGVSELAPMCLTALLNPGDEILIPSPSYSLWTNAAYLAEATPVFYRCHQENNWQPDPEEIKSLITERTRAILIINPNNPTGALMSRELLEQIIEIARGADAYVLCDEVYRHLTQADGWCESVVDLYEKGISVSSMSKVFSLAGIRMGWIATRDKAAVKAFLSHRDYNLISCGMFDDAVASIALCHSDKMIHRNQAIVRENLAILDEWMQAHPHFYYTKPQAGTTALVYYDYDIPSYEFCERLYHETGSFVTPGDCFEQPRSMRIVYACDAQTLKDGLAALADFSDKLN